jgi:glutathione S-transferase
MTASSAAARIAVLITMPHSHYAEKARWALDRSGLAYREEPHLPLLHRLATRRHGGGSVPVLAHGHRRCIDSTEILVHADAACGGDRLYPGDPALRREVEALEERFDAVLGPHTRRWAYFQVLDERAMLRAMVSRGVPARETRWLPLLLPIAIPAIRRGLRVTVEGAERSLARVDEVFREVGARLADGRRFLVGERFSAADLGFAALAAPVLLPEECRASYPPLDAVPARMRDEIVRLRETAAGRFALRLYREERAGPLSPSSASPPRAPAAPAGR